MRGGFPPWKSTVWTFPVRALMWNYAIAQPDNAIGRDWAA